MTTWRNWPINWTFKNWHQWLFFITKIKLTFNGASLVMDIPGHFTVKVNTPSYIRPWLILSERLVLVPHSDLLCSCHWSTVDFIVVCIIIGINIVIYWSKLCKCIATHIQENDISWALLYSVAVYVFCFLLSVCNTSVYHTA